MVRREEGPVLTIERELRRRFRFWSGMDTDLAGKLRALAERVSHNVPLRRDLERFHVEKSCIAQDLEHLAREIDEQASRSRVGEIAINRRRQGHVTVQRPQNRQFP